MTVATAVSDLLSWAWDRHQNVLSWYIRPLFLIPLAWAAYRRSPWGIAATVVAMMIVILAAVRWLRGPRERPAYRPRVPRGQRETPSR